RRLHGQRGETHEAVRALVNQLGDLIVLDARRRRDGLTVEAVQKSLRRVRHDLHVDLGGVHVLQPPIEVPTAAGKRPICGAGHFEHAEVVVDRGVLDAELRQSIVQEAHRLVAENMRVNVDRFHEWIRVSSPSWPGSSRPSTSCLYHKTWMPGTRPGMTMPLVWACVISLGRLAQRAWIEHVVELGALPLRTDQP